MSRENEGTTKQLGIEWKHLEIQGRTCDYRSDTGQAVREVVEELQQEPGRAGVVVSFTETMLGEDRIPESNEILFSGVLLEDLLPGIRPARMPSAPAPNSST